MKQSEILRNLRTKKGLTAKQVAEACEIPYNVYLGYEGDKRTLGVSPIVRLADFYGISADIILGREVVNQNEPVVDALSRIKDMASQIGELSDEVQRSI